MPGPIPNLQFAPYNPMDTAIQTALGVFGAGMQGQNLRTQNQMNKAKMPFIAPTAEAELQQLQQMNQAYPDLTKAQIANLYSENQKRNADIMIQQQMLAALGLGGGGQQPAGGQQAPMPAGGVMPTGAGNTGMVSNPNTSMGAPLPPIGAQQQQPQFLQGAPESFTQPQPQANNSGLPNYGQTAARKYFGLPEMSPQEQLTMDSIKNQQNQTFNKQLEKTEGTTGYNTQAQQQAQSIKNALPIIDEIIDTAPGQMFEWMWSPNKQSTYKSQIANLKEKMMTAFNYPKNEESFRTVSDIIEYKGKESLENYQERMLKLKNELMTIYGDIGQRPLETKATNFESSKTGNSEDEQEALKRGFKKVNGKWVKG